MSRNAADFCRFLAYTGCRLSEAQAATWGDVDFKRGILRVYGSKTEASDREVPLIPATRALLERLHLAQISSPSVPKVADGSLDPKRPALAVGGLFPVE